MSTTLERPTNPASDDGERTRAEVAAHGRRGGWSRRRVELRLAARQARRAWPTSLLVIALVALPMALISGAATFSASRAGTTEQKVASELGHADSWLMIVGGEDPTRQQMTSDPYWYEIDRDDDGMPVNPELPPASDLDGLVPDVELLEVAEATVTARTPGGIGTLKAYVGAAVDERLDGRYELVDGRRPRTDGETAVSPGALARWDVEIGDTLELDEPAATLRIVGIMKDAASRDDEQTAFVADAVVPEDMREPMATRWFAPEWQPTASELAELNRAGVIVYARDAVTRAQADTYTDPASAWNIAGIAMIVGGFTAYLVILLAGAGFAVSARRQERSLAVAASVGADRGSVFRIVLMQGGVLGLVGGVLGAGIGIALAYPALVLFDDGAVAGFWGFHVPWWGIAGVVLFATAVGTASALAPARAATKGDVLASLRGTRRPPAMRTDRPFWGTLLAAVGVGLTVAGGLGLAALNAADVVDYGNPARTFCLIGIIAGPLLFQIGAILAGHWMLTMIARGSSRIGLAPRIAARDAAANPARIVPAFAAIAACVFLASFALTGASVYMAQSARNWWYQAPVGSVVVNVWTDGENPAVLAQAVAALEETDPSTMGTVRGDVDAYASGDLATREWQDPLYPEVFGYDDCATIEAGFCLDRAGALFGTSGSAVVVGADDLDTVLGVPIDPATRAAFADGGAVVTTPASTMAGGAYLDGDEVVLNRWNREELDEYWTRGGGAAALPDPLESVRVPAQEIRLPHTLPWPVIISPQVADRIGYETIPAHLIAAYDRPPAQQSLDRLAQIAGQPWSAEGGFDYAVENGPPASDGWLWLILGVAGILVLGAGGVALGLARIERRPDDATLSAVGASRRLRRGIAFWQAIVIVGVGSLTGTIAGLIPMWGIVMQSASNDQYALRMADTPWAWLVLLALGLPLAIAVVSWLVPPRRPDLTRRTVIA
ncbi:putative ABC transport system permease protein [Microbacterium sp. ZKA21]|uniref:FtsX-like permease family protein n=1 Tax=Microbacterium sp. ZKA21 TaxID=3381694 RepID=UPI003D20B544